MFLGSPVPTTCHINVMHCRKILSLGIKNEGCGK